MSGRTLNLGILAHVDAGKTTLTERLLHDAGIIERVGTVDAGTTVTDSLELERERGITIKSAVVSFPIDNVTVNLIDTPGHPDFIAEVERALIVLDGAVLVISAVEGVQPQTRVLMRALRRLGIPTLLFVNKLDRQGADDARVLGEITDRLGVAAIRMGTTRAVGTRAAAFTPSGWTEPGFRGDVAQVLADHDDRILAAYVEDAILEVDVHRALIAQTERVLVHPAFFGSAMTGAGVSALMSAIAELLPSSGGRSDGPASGTVFKIERDASGHKLAFVRVRTGTIHTRDRVRFGAGETGTVTGLAAFARGTDEKRSVVRAGEVAKVRGLEQIRIGDTIGDGPQAGTRLRFAPPTLESVVVPLETDHGPRLKTALTQLAEQDPLIGVHVNDADGLLSVSLYGEVQKEVIQATLARDFGVEVEFRRTTQIHIERPLAVGEAVEVMHAPSNPYNATIGLLIEPARPGSGLAFSLGLDVDHRSIPLFVYGSTASFAASMDGYVRDALRAGLLGWQVTDCAVTMHRSMYSSADGPPSTRGPMSTAADFRKLTPLVIAEALAAAGTTVCEPILRLRLEIPTQTVATVMPALARRGAAIEARSPRGSLSTIEIVVAAARAHDLQRDLPGLTGGEGVLESEFFGYRPVTGQPPRRPE